MAQTKKKAASGGQAKDTSYGDQDSRQHNRSDQSSTNPFTFEEMERMFRHFTRMKAPAFDREALLNNHKRNMEAIGEASRMAIDVMRSLGELQTQFMRQAFEDISAMAQQGISAPLGPDAFNRQTEAMQNTFKRAQEHASNIGRVFHKAGQEAQHQTQKQMEENIDLFNQMTSKYKN